MSTGRKDLTKIKKQLIMDVPSQDKELPDDQQQQSLGSKVCGVMKLLVGYTKELISGPATSLSNCLEALFDTSELTGKLTICKVIIFSTSGHVCVGDSQYFMPHCSTGDNKYYCEHCKRY